jgi:hypothetical protein
VRERKEKRGRERGSEIEANRRKTREREGERWR